MLGKAKRVRIEKENTTIIDGAGSKKDIEGRIAGQAIDRASCRRHCSTSGAQDSRSRVAWAGAFDRGREPRRARRRIFAPLA
jgi:hypothetical protein